MTWITTKRLQREFAMPRALANEIVAEQMQQAVRHRWQPRLWMACWAVPALACRFGWLPGQRGVHDHAAALWLELIACGGWAVLGYWLAGLPMLAAAAAKARWLNRHAAEKATP